MTPPAPAKGKADLGEDLTTLADIAEAPRDYLYELSDPHDPEVTVRFLITPRAVNCSRIMKERGIACLCVTEMACLLAGSHRLIERGLGGMTAADFKRYVDTRLAGAPLKLMPVAFFTYDPTEPPCASPSTFSDDARPLEQLASTSTGTTSKPPADPASETPV